MKVPTKNKSLIQAILEALAITAIFYLFAAWPVPDSNEAHYIGKAIHCWNPNWIPNDSFLDSKDSHLTFYIIFGWLHFFFSPIQMAWIGRLSSWLLLACAWQRFSHTLLPVRWFAVATAIAIAYYIDSFHMAGEWLLGGVEGKSFAFAFVFFGLNAMIRGHWHRTWILLGIASSLHVLVGGWTVSVCGFVWLLTDGKQRLRKKDFNGFPWGLLLGGALSLFGLVPALFLDAGTPQEIVRQAHRIYVFDRLYHHLVPYKLPWTYVARFFLLVLLWFSFCRFPSTRNRKLKRFDLFIWGTLLLSMFGFVAAYGLRNNPSIAAEILRFYWFRLADIAVPMGVAIGAARKLLPLLRQFRTQSLRPDFYPTFFEWFVFFALPFGVYLLLDDLIFGRLFFSWTLPVEQGIPWILTLLICGSLLFLLKNISSLAAHFKIRASFRFWGHLLIYVAILFYAPFDSLKRSGDQRTRFAYARSEPGHAWTAHYWIDACRWISNPENTAPTAKFWVPREAATFKWHAMRSDVGTWKDIPQDARSIVRWYDAMQELFECDHPENNKRSLTVHLWWKTDDEIKRLQEKYGFDYILCTAFPALPHLKSLQGVYENQYYRIYKVDGTRQAKQAPPQNTEAKSDIGNY